MPLIRCLNVIRNGIQSWHSRRGMAGRAARRRFFQPLGCEPLESRRLLAMDFGDAPDTYGTLLGGVGGARHTVGSGLFLGATVDGEADANAPLDGTGDDVTGSDDEDGVTLNSNLVPGQPVSLTIVASATGFLDAWFDLSFDGTFTDQDEQFLNSVPVVAGANNFSQLIPSNTPFGTTFARFRISSAGGLFPTGPAPDGEVEDYPILIQTVNRFTVNNIGDTADAAPGNGVCADSIGNCTLRAAIQETNALANLAAGPDVILFDIPGSGPHTISPTSALPTITDRVIIDGTSEPNFVSTPVVVLNGTSAGALANGLKITAGGSTVKGLAINRFLGNGIELRTGGGNVIERNFIGTSVGGTADQGNALDGVLIVNSAGNTVGGTTTAKRNVISGNNRYGVEIINSTSTGNVVQGNYIGTNAAGTGVLGNSLSGVLVFNAPSNTIGGIVTGARNIISGNTQRGVYLSGAGATGNLVQGNRIGTNAAGTADLGNSLSGVEIGSGASSNTIGGTTVAARNIISGNNQHGVYLLGSGTTGNMVRGNYVGTTVNGTTALGNMLAGVRLVGVSSNSIGGTASGAGNRIGFNGQNGVRVTGLGTANLILRNSIFTNTGLGIDLNGDGVTANDTNDSDTGPNKLQNFPVMTSVVLSGANLNITYSIPSITPNSTYPIRVEFFIADADNQEGKTFLSSHSYTSPGVKVATIPAGSAVLGTKIVATATDTNGAGSTSEFSANRTVASSLLAAGGAAPAGTGAASLTSAQQRPVVDSAISRLIAQGLTATQVNQLSSVTVDIADLPGAGGTEIHVGLNGNDPLSGGPGNEFLVVGRGQGVLNGKGNQNRLPPGVTHFAAVDDNTAFLQSISATQSGAGPFAARRAVLTPDLVPRSTVLNAGNAAPLTSHADLILDRLFAALADGVIKDAGDLLTLF